MLWKISFTIASLAAVASGVPVPAPVQNAAAIADNYIFYRGNGSTGAGWPSQASWGSWNDLWNANVPLMQNSCNWNNWGDNDSSSEIAGIQSAIQQLAGSTGIDQRFILAVMMQESKGCVRVPTTNNGVVNPGLMQSHNGAGTCAGVKPCPNSRITQMISDGVAGTSSGSGLQQLLSQAQGATGDHASRAYYASARLYNSGSADYSNLNNGLGSTACYASDVANRLTGWTLAASNCRA